MKQVMAVGSDESIKRVQDKEMKERNGLKYRIMKHKTEEKGRNSQSSKPS